MEGDLKAILIHSTMCGLNALKTRLEIQNAVNDNRLYNVEKFRSIIILLAAYSIRYQENCIKAEVEPFFLIVQPPTEDKQWLGLTWK